MIELADNQNKLFSFRIYTMRGENFGGPQIPQWVLDNDPTMIQNNEPNYSNCAYQSAWAIFVDVLRQRYDGDDRIAFIDISGYGGFNEWNFNDQTVFDDDPFNPASLDGQARIRLAEMFIGGSDNDHSCIGSNGSTQTVAYNYVGFQETQLLMPYAGIQQTSRYVAAQRSDVGIRYDCLGRVETPNTDIIIKIGDLIDLTYPNAPIVFEFCTGSTTDSDVIQRAENLINDAHATLIHDNLEEPRDQAVVEDLMRNVGYRYYLASATYDNIVNAGDDISLTMDWQNVGTAPSYPSMSNDFELRAYLVDNDGNVELDIAISDDIETWQPAATLPGAGSINTLNTILSVPPDLTDGSYNLRVAIINRSTGQAINLAFDGADNLGRYLIGQVEVSSDVDTATLIANFSIQGRSDFAVPVMVNIYPIGSTTPIYQFTPVATSTGQFSVSGIVPDSYQVAIKTTQSLQVVEISTLTVGDNIIDFGQLMTGDIDDNNLVNITDFSLLASSFNQSQGDSGYLVAADLNGDNSVTILDFSLLAANFNVGGEEPTATP